MYWIKRFINTLAMYFFGHMMATLVPLLFLFLLFWLDWIIPKIIGDIIHSLGAWLIFLIFINNYIKEFGKVDRGMNEFSTGRMAVILLVVSRIMLYPISNLEIVQMPYHWMLFIVADELLSYVLGLSITAVYFLYVYNRAGQFKSKKAKKIIS